MKYINIIIVFVCTISLGFAGLDNPSPNSETLDGLDSTAYLHTDGSITADKLAVTGSIYQSSWYTNVFTGTNVIINFNNGNFQTITLTNNAHLWATNIQPMNLILRIAQDVVGSRTLSYDTKWDSGTNSVLPLTVTASKEDVLSGFGISSTKVYYRITTGGFTP